MQDLQQIRRIETRRRLNHAATAYMMAVRRNQYESFEPKTLGFEFTLQQIKTRAMELQRSPFSPLAAEKLSDARDLLF